MGSLKVGTEMTGPDEEEQVGVSLTLGKFGFEEGEGPPSTGKMCVEGFSFLSTLSMIC